MVEGETPSSRWRSLGAFLGALIISQIFGFNFIPVLHMLAAKYGVTELTASYTILVFSLSRILFSSAAGALIDRRGFRYSVLVGLAVISAFSCLRIFASSFWVLLTAQIGISVAVPFIMVAIPKVVANLFPRADATRVSGYCAIGINIGASSSLWLSPYIILGMGFHRAMILFASLAICWTLVFALLVPRSRGQASRTVRSTGRFDPTSIVDLFRIRTFAILMIIVFIGHGLFTCVTTWLGVLWHEHGFSSQAAGKGASVLILGGVLGCLVIPTLLSRFRSSRLLLWTAYLPAIVLVAPYLWARTPGSGLILGGLMGFFYLSSIPAVFGLITRSVPPRLLGIAGGVELTVGSLGGMIVTVCFRLLKDSGGWKVATVTLVAALSLMSVLVALIPDAPPRSPSAFELEVEH